MTHIVDCDAWGQDPICNSPLPWSLFGGENWFKAAGTNRVQINLLGGPGGLSK